MHAQLRAITRERFHCGREALGTQVIGDGLDVHRPSGSHRAGDQSLGALGGKRGDCFASLPLGHEPQGLECQGVVRLVACGATGCCQREYLARAPTPGVWIWSVGRSIEGLDQDGICKSVKWAAHGRCGNAQSLRNGRCRGGAVLGQAAGHTLGGLGREFHNTIVT
jgi:hypothetical protein